ncbi:hypothetical protein [Nonomuraea sp. NPDC050643]|uniref:hypothetical protein n=1 Tax=Nonomuraea sp. NPDC050643 TaxID=3155660 RepID=UPI00340E0BF1
MTLDDFTEDILRRSQWAQKHNDGHPNPAWSTGEQLAVAWVLKDKAHFEATGWKPVEAARRILDDMAAPPAAFGAWIETLRGRLAASQTEEG